MRIIHVLMPGSIVQALEITRSDINGRLLAHNRVQAVTCIRAAATGKEFLAGSAIPFIPSLILHRAVSDSYYLLHIRENKHNTADLCRHGNQTQVLLSARRLWIEINKKLKVNS